jgi:hypothetical protein
MVAYLLERKPFGQQMRGASVPQHVWSVMREVQAEGAHKSPDGHISSQMLSTTFAKVVRN